jgi:hypothetical protein
MIDFFKNKPDYVNRDTHYILAGIESDFANTIKKSITEESLEVIELNTENDFYIMRGHTYKVKELNN